MNEDEYIQKWIDRTVTLLEWSQMKYTLIDHWEILDKLDLDSEELTKIFYHQLDLFQQRVNNEVKHRIEEISTNYSISERSEIVKDKLYVIDSFLKSFEVNHGLIRIFSRSVVRIDEIDYLNILESVHRVKSKIIDPDNPNNYDINRKSSRNELDTRNHYDSNGERSISTFDYSRSYFIASFILKYQSELNKILNEKSIDEKPEKNKGYTNQLTTNQKKVVDQLVNNGHTDSHIYHLLKQNNFFTLTEIEFRDYLNKFHGKKLDVNKRITALKNLTFTAEIKQTFEELQDKYIPK